MVVNEIPVDSMALVWGIPSITFFYQRRKQGKVSEQNIQRKGHIRGMTLEGGPHLRGKAALVDFPALHFPDKPTHTGNSAVIRGIQSAMAFVSLPRSTAVQVPALFMDGNHSTFGLHTGNHAGGDGAAFVKNRFKTDALLPEIGRSQNHSIATDLFVVGGAYVQVDAFQVIPFPQQLLAGLKLGKQGRFGIDGSPAIEGAILFRGAERIGIPALASVHHIMMGHQHDVLPGVFPAEHIDKAAAAKAEPFRLFRQNRKAFLQNGVKAIKFQLIGSVFGEYGFAVHHLFQCVCIAPAHLRGTVFPPFFWLQASLFHWEPPCFPWFSMACVTAVS